MTVYRHSDRTQDAPLANVKVPPCGAILEKVSVVIRGDSDTSEAILERFAVGERVRVVRISVCDSGELLDLRGCSGRVVQVAGAWVDVFLVGWQTTRRFRASELARMEG